MSNIITKIKAELYSTESPEKVEKAIKNIFGEININQEKIRGEIYLTATINNIDNLRHFREILARERIRDAVRSMFSRWSSDEEGLSFSLNRQAAFAGHPSIYHANKAPLGPIQVKIQGPPEQVIEFLCGKK